MKIAMLGGSFDPPHLGHKLISQQIIELLPIDEVWLMPNFTTTTHHKVFQKDTSSSKDRLAMTKLIASKQIIASDFELKQNKESITIKTLQLLSEQFPQHIFYLVIGSDKLETFHLWDDWQKIIKDFHLIIFPRGIAQKQLDRLTKQTLRLQSIPQNVIVLDNKELILSNISSTTIRERVKKSLPIDFLVSKSVDNYIKNHKLYA